MKSELTCTFKEQWLTVKKPAPQDGGRQLLPGWPARGATPLRGSQHFRLPRGQPGAHPAA